MAAEPIDFTIVIDTREQTPLPFDDNVRTERDTLRTGDYSVRGYESVIAIERKSLPDLVGSVTHDRERFEAELIRLAQFPYRYLIIEALLSKVREPYEFSMAEPKAIEGSVRAFAVRYGLNVRFCDGRIDAAREVRAIAHYFVREMNLRLSASLRKERNQKENMNNEH